jgi:glycosyltransferase involved in cell wall biosynthesis
LNVDRSLRVFCSAYACEPGHGSEPGIGWNVVTALSDWHEVWVLTRENNRQSIDRALSQNPRPSLHFVYFDLPARLRWWKRRGRGIRTYYRLWQHGALNVATQLNERVGFDVAQHVTFGQYWSPSFLSQMSVPYVWGPVGGAEVFPRSLYSGTSPRSVLASEIRRGFPIWAERFPKVKQTARRSAIALAATPESAGRIRSMGARRVEVLSAVGLNREDIASIDQAAIRRQDSGPVRFLTVTRLIGTKGVELGIRAFLSASIAGATYDIVGDGPDRRRLERLVRKAGATDRVRFHGWLARETTLREYASADALVHLSPAESGGFVCLEAMAAGMPVIYLAAGGPSVVVPDGAGIGIQLGETETVVKRVAEAMSCLSEDPSLRGRLARQGRRHAISDGLWTARASRLARLLADAAELR